MTDELATAVCEALTAQLETLRNSVADLVRPLTEDEFWRRPVEPGNSPGHLVLHLTGNLHHFVGGQLGGSGYVRQREREFTETNPPPKAVALAQLDDAVATFRRVASGLTADQLLAPHPEARFGSVLNALVTVVCHFALHRGQMSYLVRLVRPPA